MTPRQTYLEGLYLDFLSLGPTRTIAAVAQKHGISVMELAKHAQAHNWTARVAEQQDAAVARAGVDLSDMLVRAQAQHLELLEVLRAKALKALNTDAVPFDKMSDVLSAVEKVVKLQRIVLGLDSNDAANATENRRAELVKKVAAEERPSRRIEVDVMDADYTYNPKVEAPDLPEAPPSSDEPLKDPQNIKRVRGRPMRFDQVQQHLEPGYKLRVRKATAQAALKALQDAAKEQK